MKRENVTFVLLGLLLVGPAHVAASSRRSAAAPQPRLVSVRLVPEEATLLGARSSQRFLVLGRFTDGLERDVTARSRFSVADPGLAQVADAGRVTALADGTMVVRAELEGRVAEARLRIRDSEQREPLSFLRDVEGILTKHGCNSTSCHGGVKGRGGFKLSLNGVIPREDYRWIVEGGTYQVLTEEPAGPSVPRINRDNPEKSFLLLKPTFSVSHGGGQRFDVGSADYETLVRWIRSGIPYGEEKEGRFERVDVFPREAVLDQRGKHRLLVTAYLRDGRQEDITDHVLYESNNAEVVKVTPEGLVEAVKTGETAVTVRAAGHVASARFGVISKTIPSYPDVERWNFIDEFVFGKLRRFHVLPSELSSDAEFLRRVCLDVTGTLPPPERVREFLADRNPRKRERLVQVLLDSPEYVDYWTFRFGDLFRVALNPAGGSPKFSQAYWEWLRRSIAENRPYDQIARERIAAQGYDGASRHYLPILQPPLPQDAAAEEVRVFLGRRLDCAQCHDHPFEAWTQDQFWGITAFFRRLTFYWFLDVGVETIVLDDPDGYSRRGNMGKVIHPRTKREAEPTFLDGTVAGPEARSDPRMALARWVIAHPYFAQTAVNRMWSYFFGRGIVEPVDDFRASNPPTHPELLDALAEDFERHRYDLKHLIRRITSSRTYQLSSRPNENNRGDGINYSRAVPRPLDAEVLLDAISQVTEVPETFKLPRGGQAPDGTRAIQLKEPDMYPSRFLEVHGRPTRQMVPERNPKPNLGQALHRLAGVTYTEKLARPGGCLDRLLRGGATDREIVEGLYLAALSRFPAREELPEIEASLQAATRRRGSRREALEDFLWALLSSQEFTHNY